MQKKDELFQKLIDETCKAHRKIIDDWSQSYVAQFYIDNRFMNPGDFVLFDQVPNFHSRENCIDMVNRYYFESKENRDK